MSKTDADAYHGFWGDMALATVHAPPAPPAPVGEAVMFSTRRIRQCTRLRIASCSWHGDSWSACLWASRSDGLA